MVCFVHLTCKFVSRHSCVQFFHIPTSKVVRNWCVFNILAYKCVSRFTGVQIFPHPNFKKWSGHGVFCPFDLQICFSPQLRAIFPHPNFKSGPELVCFKHFGLQMRFSLHGCAIFPHPNIKKVVRTWCVLCILTCKCVSRFTGVQFFIFALNSYTSAPAALASLLFDRRPTNHWKNITFRDFANILRGCISSFY